MNNSGGEIKLELVDTRVSSMEELTQRVVDMADFSTYRFCVDSVDFTFHWTGTGPVVAARVFERGGLYYGPILDGSIKGLIERRFTVKPKPGYHTSMRDERHRMASLAAKSVFEMVSEVKAEEILRI